MTKTKSIYLSVLAILLSPMAANADLIEGKCDGTADTTVTCDTNTGLEWLDLTLTLGLSGNEFISDIGGWISQGWSLALETDVDALLLAAGFTDLTGSGTLPSQLAAGQLMVNLFGSNNFNDGDAFGNQGFSFSSSTGLAGQYYAYVLSAGGGVAIGSVNCCFTYDHSFVDSIGIWANRTGNVAVPEPGTLALLGLGLVGMAARRRKTV